MSGHSSSALHPYKARRRAFAPTKLFHELYGPKKLKSLLKEINIPRHLINCASFNDLDGLRTWLEAGVSANSTDSQKRTCLHVAASKGYDEMVGVLLAAKADPNKQDILGNTPLHLAFSATHHKVCITLMTNGASSNIRDERGNTVLNLLISKFSILRTCLAKKQISPSSYSKSVTEIMKIVPYIWETLDIQVPGAQQVNFGPNPRSSAALLRSVVRNVKTVHPELTNEELADACPDPFLRSVLEDVENLSINERGRAPPTILVTASSTEESSTEQPPEDIFNLDDMQAALCSNLAMNVESELLNLEQQLEGVKLSSS